MSKQPKRVARATPEEIENLNGGRGGVGIYKWQFPIEVFDGEWYRIEVKDKIEQDSALNSFRKQAQAKHQKRAQCYKSGDTLIYARMTKLPYEEGQAKRRISAKELEDAK